MTKYVITWLDASNGILAETHGEALDLTSMIAAAYAASQREDGEGAVQCTIELAVENEEV